MRLIVRYLTVAFLACWTSLGAGLLMLVYSHNPTWGDRLFAGGLFGAVYTAVSFGLAVAIRDVWKGWVSSDDD